MTWIGRLKCEGLRAVPKYTPWSLAVGFSRQGRAERERKTVCDRERGKRAREKGVRESKRRGG